MRGRISLFSTTPTQKPAMSFSGDPLEERYTQHIYVSKENASGGYAVGGGGCGCN